MTKRVGDHQERRGPAAKGFLGRGVGLLALFSLCCMLEAFGQSATTTGPGSVKAKDPRAVDLLIAALEGKDVPGRRAAARALGETRDSRAVKPLIAALKDEDFVVRLAAAEALGKTQDPRAVEGLISALSDTRSRGPAASGLKQIGELAVQPLIAILTDKDEDVRYLVLGVLGAIGDPRSIEPLTAVLNSKLEREPRVDAFGTSLDPRRRAAEALGHINDARAFESLSAALSSQDVVVRRAVVDALGKSKDPRAVEPLIAALNDRDKDVRRLAARHLKDTFSRDPRVVKPLGAAMHDKDELVRSYAFSALKENRGPQSLEPLMAILRSGNTSDRMDAAEALGILADERAVEALARVARKDKKPVRYVAVEALERIGGRRAIEALIAALDDKERYIRERARTALISIGKRAKDLIAAALEHESETVRFEAAAVLAAWSDPRAAKPLSETLREDRSKDVNDEAADSLIRLLGPEEARALGLGLSVRVIVEPSLDVADSWVAGRYLEDFRSATLEIVKSRGLLVAEGESRSDLTVTVDKLSVSVDKKRALYTLREKELVTSTKFKGRITIAGGKMRKRLSFTSEKFGPYVCQSWGPGVGNPNNGMVRVYWRCEELRGYEPNPCFDYSFQNGLQSLLDQLLLQWRSRLPGK